MQLPPPGLCSHLCPSSPERKTEAMPFPFSRRSWDPSEEFPRSTFNCNPGACSSLPRTPNQVALPAPPHLQGPQCLLGQVPLRKEHR